MATKIRIVLRSVEKYFAGGLPPHDKKIGLPEKRVLFTVLRSPHVHKKSREQFWIRKNATILEISARTNELAKKFFWLKRYGKFGGQAEIQFFHKSRLDKEIVKSLLYASK